MAFKGFEKIILNYDGMEFARWQDTCYYEKC